MDLENLKKRIEENKKKSVVEEVSHFSKYLNYYNLKIGIDKIPTHLLYYAYKSFLTRDEGELPLSKVSFFKELKRHFKTVRWGKQRYYLLDRSLIQNIDTNLEFRANLWKKSQATTKEKTSYTHPMKMGYTTRMGN